MAASAKINTSVSPSLHPDTVRALDGFDDDSESYLGPVMALMDDAYNSIGDIHSAREAAQKDESLTPAQRILRLAKMGEAHQDRLAKKWDAVYKNLTTSIAALEKQLSAPMKAAAERPGIAAEIRQHAKGLTPDQRMKLLDEAEQRDDLETVQAILGAPAFLSGMTEEFRAVRTRQFHENQAPQVARRLKVSKAAATLMESRGGLLLTGITQAIGADWTKVKRLRDTSDATEQAFIVRDYSVDLG